MQQLHLHAPLYYPRVELVADAIAISGMCVIFSG